MGGLRFSTDQITSEIQGMADLAEVFLSGQHSQSLRRAGHDLKNALRSGGIWQIPRHNPLETVESEEAGSLFGRLSFQWEVRPVKTHRFFHVGNASTTIEIHGLSSSGPLVSWNTDIGGPSHPGYRFHSQIVSNGNSLAVPRLPSILVTPTDCLDFLLGELFQKKWEKHQVKEQGRTAGWTQGVRKRICHLLHWKAERAAQSRGMTPWMTLKAWNFEDPELTLDNE